MQAPVVDNPATLTPPSAATTKASNARGHLPKHRAPRALTAALSLAALTVASTTLATPFLALPAQAHEPAPDTDGQPSTGINGSMPKIVNGRTVQDPGNFGLVQILTINGDEGAYRCGGTALSPNWIATSGHCLSTATTSVQAFANPVDASRRKGGVRVEQVRYAPQNPIDIAGSDLVLLRVPNLPKGVQPVPVIVSGQPTNPNLIGVGFGQHTLNPVDHTWMRSASVNALTVSLTLQPRTLCSGGQQGTATICAGEPWQPHNKSPRDDFCTGDSGSPLGTYVNGRFAVLGVESRSAIPNINPAWGDHTPNERCGFAPTVATSLRHHLWFLEQMIGPGLQTVALPTADNPQTNTLAVGSGRGGLDLRIIGTDGEAHHGTRVALQMARARFQRNASLGQHVVLASNVSFADALAGAALQRGALLMFTDKHQVPNSVLLQLRTMGTRRVTVLGGPVVVGDGVLHQLRTMGIAVERIAGPERISTSVAIAGRLGRGQGAYLVRAFGQGSAGFADSLAAGAAAARRNWPVLLTSTESLSAPTQGMMGRHPEVTIVGGPAAISANVRLQVAGMIPKVNQAQGADRTKTAEQLAQPSHNGSVIVLDGFDPGAWHGGFAASGLAADIDAPILLTNPATNGADIAAQLDGITPDANASFVCVADQPLCDRFYHLWLN